MSEHRYDPTTIEPKWQAVWEEEQTWHVSNDDEAGRPKSYVLEMLPYPSGEPHMGHLKNYAVGDAVAHFHRRTGRRVLHPMGYDAFGLPAENHAIKTGEHPRDSTAASIAQFQKQFREWGISIDWSREFATSEPRYYRWTQWIFLRLFERGLAYRKEAAVNWCPKDATVLANEQVIDGRCERCGTLVEVRQLEQWFFRITDYADRLLDDLADIDWPHHVVTMQRNWIGRSEGAEVTFRCEALERDYAVFTTRPDTLFGATFFVMAPEHPDVLRLAEGTEHEEEVRAYVNRSLTEDRAERGDVHHEKTGVPLGRTVTNPVNGEQIPMFVADYVLMEYGTGAIMAVPAHDERDFEFATKYGLPIREVVQSDDELPSAAAGPLVNSGQFDGKDNREALAEIVDWLDREGRGHRSINYRLRDWLLSRQRYWGCPIPIVHCDACGLVPVPDDQLPVLLPDDHRLQAEGALAARRRRGLGARRRARSAARPRGARRTRWTRSSTPPGTSCATATPTTTRPRGTRRSSPAGRRSTSTSAASSTPSCTCSTRASSSRRSPTWATWTCRSRSSALFTQGMITRDGAKMSKSKGNVISPTPYVERYGADTARCYTLFIGPPDQDADWSTRASRACTASSAGSGGSGAEVADGGRAAPARRRRSTARRATTSSCCARRTGRSTRSRAT